MLLDLEVLAEVVSSSAGPTVTSQSAQGASSSQHGEKNKAASGMNAYFHKFMTKLLQLFASNRQLLDDRGSFIIRLVRWSLFHKYLGQFVHGESKRSWPRYKQNNWHLKQALRWSKHSFLLIWKKGGWYCVLKKKKHLHVCHDFFRWLRGNCMA